MNKSETLLHERPARGALTRTGGFLKGFSYTLQPYIGCRFGCSYCYVRQSNVHRFFNGGLEWGSYVYSRVGIAERLELELERLHRRGALEQSAIFMSSSTDPYQSAERTYQLTRHCLSVFEKMPPGLLVIQTRAPLAARDFDLMAALGKRLLLNLTIETDQEDVRRILTPHCPSIRQRLNTVRKARERGITTQVTVAHAFHIPGWRLLESFFSKLAIGDCGQFRCRRRRRGQANCAYRDSGSLCPVRMGRLALTRGGYDPVRLVVSPHRKAGGLVTGGIHAPGPRSDRRVPLTAIPRW